MKLMIFVSFIILLFGCSKTDSPQEIILIPNGDFENWDNTPSLLNWQTNSCPLCVPPIDTYVVKQDANAYNGQFDAKFIYNNVYAAWATNKFSIPKHPSLLTGYVKCNLTGMDTIRINISLYKNMILVDSGNWIGNSSIANYTQLNIPITQNKPDADSALIRIEGGKKTGTVLWVDNLYLIKK